MEGEKGKEKELFAFLLFSDSIKYVFCKLVNLFRWFIVWPINLKYDVP